MVQLWGYVTYHFNQVKPDNCDINDNPHSTTPYTMVYLLFELWGI